MELHGIDAPEPDALITKPEAVAVGDGHAAGRGRTGEDQRK